MTIRCGYGLCPFRLLLSGVLRIGFQGKGPSWVSGLRILRILLWGHPMAAALSFGSLPSTTPWKRYSASSNTISTKVRWGTRSASPRALELLSRFGRSGARTSEALDGACVQAHRVQSGQSGPWALNRPLRSLLRRFSLKGDRISRCLPGSTAFSRSETMCLRGMCHSVRIVSALISGRM